MEQEFLKPRLVGTRFQDHTVPLEILKDFSALQEMLVEVAKWEFRRSHPNRYRIPRNFTDGVDLHLTTVGDGSAILTISLIFSTLVPTSKNLTYFEAARAHIVDAVASAERAEQPFLPPDLLAYFDRFGRSLRPGESIQFPRANEVATLTPDIRNQLMKYAQRKEWTEESSLRVKVPEADKGRGTFEMETLDGAKVKGRLTSLYQDIVLDAFTNYGTGREEFVLVQGVLKRDRDGHLKEFESIEHVTPLDPLDTKMRLEEIAKLSDGWLNGKGKAPEKGNLEWLQASIDGYFNSELPLPHLYPTPEAGVQAEWTLGDWEVSLDVDLEARVGTYQAFNVKDGSLKETVFALKDEAGWDALNSALEEIVPNGPQEFLNGR